MNKIKIGIKKVDGNDPYFYMMKIDTVNEVLINGIYLRYRFDETLKLRAYSQYRTRENKEWEITLPFNAEAAIKMINEINDYINRPETIEFDFNNFYEGTIFKDAE